ncbi:MAG: hypothetical protein ACR2O4_15355 [Hyphomicrobiaceae bacterium]
MNKLFASLAVAATLGLAISGTATTASADTINAPPGAGVTNGSGYPDWADQVFGPKGESGR